MHKRGSEEQAVLQLRLQLLSDVSYYTDFLQPLMPQIDMKSIKSRDSHKNRARDRLATPIGGDKESVCASHSSSMLIHCVNKSSTVDSRGLHNSEARPEDLCLDIYYALCEVWWLANYFINFHRSAWRLDSPNLKNISVLN